MKNQQNNQTLDGRHVSSPSVASLVTGTILLMLSVCYLLLIASCTKNECEDCPSEDNIISSEMTQSQIQEKLITVEDGETLEFKPGTYNFTSNLTLEGKANVKIKGAEGSSKTTWNFEDQTEGGEGFLATNCMNFEISNITIMEAKGDGIKVKDSDGVTFINISAIWESDKSVENGAYGIYPVLCNNVLVEGCYAKGSSDAGIYVGQSTNAVIRNCKAEKNVVGIEVENTVTAEVYNNEVSNNSCGILILDLQNLIQSGKQTIVYNNKIINNNYDNFALAGTIAAITPAGTGILILASREAELYNNEILNNNLISVSIVSYIAISAITGEAITDPEFDPYFDQISVYENTISNSTEVNVTGQSDLGLLLLSIFGENPIPEIMTDGIFKPGTDATGGLCIVRNEGGAFVNLDVINGFANPTFDVSPHECDGI